MTERAYIRQRYQEEQIGKSGLRKRFEAALFDEDKRKWDWVWLDEKANDEARAYRARQLGSQERNDHGSNFSLVVSVVAVIIAALALYRSWPQDVPTPPPIRGTLLR
jgi:hypothetical protein